MKAPTVTYSRWLSLRARCCDPAHKGFAKYARWWYPPWETFQQFLADMGECPPGRTLDRVDNKAGYSPTNCRWATVAEQNRNMSVNKLTLDLVRAMRAERDISIRAIGRKYGVSSTHANRIMRGLKWVEA